MAIQIVDVLAFIKDLCSDDAKMGKFKEIVADVKELINDIKTVVGMCKA